MICQLIAGLWEFSFLSFWLEGDFYGQLVVNGSYNPGEGEDRGTLLYKPYRYVPPLKGKAFAPFRSENGYRLCPFWSGIGYGFRRNYGSVWTCMQFQFQMTKKERIIGEFGWIWRNLFVGVLIYCVMTWFRRGQTWKGIWILEARSGLKTGVKNDMFWPELRSGLVEAGGTPPPRIPRSNPWG